MSAEFDLIVIGSGPGGQQAALAAADAGLRVALVERGRDVGGACLHRGTIPSKTLRSAALELRRFQARSAEFGITFPTAIRTEHLTQKLQAVIDDNVRSIAGTLQRAGVALIHGSASFAGPGEIVVQRPGGGSDGMTTQWAVIATGSRPRRPDDLPVDHELVLDSDSILSMEYLPGSLAIVGGGVIASEYASIFAALGVEVTVIDRAERPLGFLDEELSTRFREGFEALGGRYLGRRSVERMDVGFAEIVTRLDDGTTVESERCMVALGRTACVAGLGLDAIGVEVDGRGRIVTDRHCRASSPGVYAVGDVIGRPGLASTAMEQGRRAVAHMLGYAESAKACAIPMGIYTIPEIGFIGQTEAEVRERFGEALVGRADFGDVARGHIDGESEGMLKLIGDTRGEQLLGVGIVGEGATELLAVGQMAMIHGGRPSDFVDNVFNFPTMMEAYRVAALDLARQARARRLDVPPRARCA